MSARQITPPAELAVTLDDARRNLRISGSALDLMIRAHVEGIISYAEHYCGRAFVNRPMQVVLDEFSDTIRLDRAPLVSVESVKYFDVDGVEQTLDPADYLVDMKSEPGFIGPAPGKAWPCTQVRMNAVTVDYTAGYGPTAATTPAAARLFILARLVDQFDPATGNFAQTVGKPYTTSFIDSLLDSLVVYG